MVEVTHIAWRELLHKHGLLPVADILEKYGIASAIDVSELRPVAQAVNALRQEGPRMKHRPKKLRAT